MARGEHQKTRSFTIFCHCEGFQPDLVISKFSVNLVCTGDGTSKSGVQKWWKHGVQGDEVVDITIGDNLLHSSAQLGALSWAGVIWFL